MEQMFMQNVLLRTMCHHTISSELFQLQSLIKKRKGNKLKKEEKGQNLLISPELQ